MELTCSRNDTVRLKLLLATESKDKDIFRLFRSPIPRPELGLLRSDRRRRQDRMGSIWVAQSASTSSDHVARCSTGRDIGGSLCEVTEMEREGNGAAQRCTSIV